MGWLLTTNQWWWLNPPSPKNTEAGWFAITLDTTTTRTFDVKFELGRWAGTQFRKGMKVHLGKLTWNIHITHLEGKMIFQTPMIMFHVNLPVRKSDWIEWIQLKPSETLIFYIPAQQVFWVFFFGGVQIHPDTGVWKPTENERMDVQKMMGLGKGDSPAPFLVYLCAHSGVYVLWVVVLLRMVVFFMNRGTQN